jgi:hypothetical protein
LRAGGFDEQAPLERRGADLPGQAAVLEGEPVCQPPAARAGAGDGSGQRDQRGGDAPFLGQGGVFQHVVTPVSGQGRGTGDEGEVEAAEGAVVLARLPDVEVRADQGQRQRQPVAADRLGQADDVGLDAGGLEAEERAGTAASHLHVVDDEQDAMPAAQIGQVTQPPGSGHVDAAFTLHGLDDDGGRLVEPAAPVVQQPLQEQEVRHPAPQPVVERQRCRVWQRHAGPAPVERVAGDRQRAQGHAVEGIGERDDLGAPGDLAGQFQRCFHRVGPARPRELHPVVQLPRFEYQLAQRGQELPLGDGEHVQRVRDLVGGQVIDQRALERRVVVAVIQRSGAAEEVQVSVAFFVI